MDGWMDGERERKGEIEGQKKRERKGKEERGGEKGRERDSRRRWRGTVDRYKITYMPINMIVNPRFGISFIANCTAVFSPI